MIGARMGVFESGTGTRPAVHPLGHEEEAVGPAAVSLRTHLVTSRAALIAVTLSVVAMFIPVAVVRYGHIDDYPLVWLTVSGHPDPEVGNSILDGFTVQGRPLEGLLESLAFSAAGSLDNLRFVRIFGFAGIAALGVLLHWALVRSGFRSGAAALITVLICSLPAFQVYAASAVLYSAPYAAILAGAASLVAATAIGLPRRLARRRLVVSAALLLGGLLIYQPPAMFFWVFLAIAVIGARREPGRVKRIVWVHLGVAGVAFAFAWAITKAGIHVVGANAPANAGRTALVDDLAGKLHWFFGWHTTHENGLSFHGPLFGAFGLFDLSPSPWLTDLVALVVIGGLLVLLHRERLSIPLYGGIAVLLVPLSFLPSLVVAENSPTYRVRAALSALSSQSPYAPTAK